MTRTKIAITATSAVAVIFLGSMMTGCVLPRHIEELKVEIRDVETQNEQTQEMIARLDSVITNGEEANTRLRNDISTTISQLQRQIDILLENYNDLMQKLDEISRSRGIIKSSPGSQTQTQTKQDAPPLVVQPEPSIDCGMAYDDAFILVRRGEYETAIDGFNAYLKDCQGHESVENAYYWIGECYYSMEKYTEAISQFDLLIGQFQNSPNIARARYKLGRSYQEMGRKDQAKSTFQKIVDDHPGSFEAQQAADRIKDLK